MQDAGWHRLRRGTPDSEPDLRAEEQLLTNPPPDPALRPASGRAGRRAARRCPRAGGDVHGDPDTSRSSGPPAVRGLPLRLHDELHVRSDRSGVALRPVLAAFAESYESYESYES
jgi:hypothetical protein